MKVSAVFERMVQTGQLLTLQTGRHLREHASKNKGFVLKASFQLKKDTTYQQSLQK